jgi:hypothetical protein
MKRIATPFLALVALAVAVPVAGANDASLEHALGAYKSRLTADIGYLASFSVPSRAGAGGTLSRLSTIQHDLAGARHAASAQQGSSSAGRRGRTLVLSALGDAIAAAGHAQSSANAARSGKTSTARSEARTESSDINRAIPLFQQGGTLLHLF